jgi:predicted small secreted protein
MRKRFAYTLFVALPLAAALAACNTMAGAGEDMQHGGQALTNSADKHGATPDQETPAAQPAQPAPQQ